MDAATPTPAIEAWRIATHFIFADELPFSYVLNAKGGCSTMLAHLWSVVDARRGVDTFAGDLHRGGPWSRVEQTTADQISALLAKPILSIVRNPYARALSGYLSKIGDRRAEEDQYVWTIFRTRFGLGEGEVPSFERYLDLIEREADEARDRHWATQCSNLLLPWTPIDRLFYLEHFSFLDAYFDRFGIGPAPRSAWGHRGAVDRFDQYMTTDAVARIARIYAPDFDTFGYSLDPTIQTPMRPRDGLDGRRSDFARRLLTLSRPTPHGVIDFVRDRQMAGWIRFEGDPAELQVIGCLPQGETTAAIRPDKDRPNVYLFEISFADPVAASALRDSNRGRRACRSARLSDRFVGTAALGG